MESIESELKREKLWNKNYLRVWSANFMLYFSFMLLMPLLPIYLKDRFGADPADIGLVLSGYTLTTLLIRPFSGYLVDNLPRKLVLLVSYGIFALFFSGYLVAGSLLAFTIVRTMHGMPFGAVTVANTTAAIDVLPSSRRTEGIGFFGLSNNIATAIAPSIAMLIYGAINNFDLLFIFSLAVALCGVWIDSTLDMKPRPSNGKLPHLSLDRFLLIKGWSQGLCMVCFSFSYGVMSTYVAIYGQQELGITGGTGVFFMLLALGLMLSRITGSHYLRKGKIVHNASVGIAIAACGYLLFASVHSLWAYYAAALIIGLGNGHMYPAFQNMFVNLASNDQRGTANSTLLVSWDVGMGLGVLLGGVLAQWQGFHTSFWTAWLVNMAGATLFYTYARAHFYRNKLR